MPIIEQQTCMRTACIWCRTVKSALRMGPTYQTVIVQPNGVQMQQAAELMAAEKLKPVIDRTFSFQEAV